MKLVLDLLTQEGCKVEFTLVEDNLSHEWNIILYIIQGVDINHGCSDLVVEYWIHTTEVAGVIHTLVQLLATLS